MKIPVIQGIRTGLGITAIAGTFLFAAPKAKANTFTRQKPDTFEYTIYSDGSNLKKGIFYYKTYENNQINAVDMHKEDLEASELITYPVQNKQIINQQN